MQVKSLLFALVAGSASLVAGAPQDFPGIGYLTICTDPNFEGECTTLETFGGQCINFPDEFKWKVSSLEPSWGWSCDLAYVSDCNYNSGFYHVSYTGDYSHLPQGNDAFISAKCNLGA